MDRKYFRIIFLIAKYSSINLDDCRTYCPDISSGTFYSVLGKLEKHGLVKKEFRPGNLVLYRKTKEFSIEKAVEAIKANNVINVNNKSENLREVVLKTVSGIVDPASRLTFAEMGTRISVKEEQDFIQIEFSPPFCRVAAEFAMYIDNAVKRIPGLKKVQIRCMGQICKHENSNEMNASQVSQVRLATPKSLLDFYENTT
jgi:metal-sulfur cluster biosynthetic enzyme